MILRDNKIAELEKENKALKARIAELESAVLPRTSTGEPVAQTASKMLKGMLDMSDFKAFQKEMTEQV